MAPGVDVGREDVSKGVLCLTAGIAPWVDVGGEEIKGILLSTGGMAPGVVVGGVVVDGEEKMEEVGSGKLVVL